MSPHGRCLVSLVCFLAIKGMLAPLVRGSSLLLMFMAHLFFRGKFRKFPRDLEGIVLRTIAVVRDLAEGTFFAILEPFAVVASMLLASGFCERKTKQSKPRSTLTIHRFRTQGLPLCLHLCLLTSRLKHRLVSFLIIPSLCFASPGGTLLCLCMSIFTEGWQLQLFL